MKKSMLTVPVLALFLCSGCEMNLHFNDFEKSLLEIYNEGDTLIFESDKGVRDTSYIILKDIGSSTSDPVFYLGKYQKLRGIVYYGVNKVKDDNMFLYDMLSLHKSRPDTTRMYLSYKGNYMSGRFHELSIESLEDYKVEDGLYRFRDVRTYKGVTEETELYFDLKYGIVKYITSEGEVWKRINIPRQSVDNTG